ncbi:MAG: sulfurtransferase TusA family protein [Alphaproteobacteria bacterium]|nr:sulfurtransferase TusA family protein [Alphaproteobacteria bacterium]MCZ6496289.1 sulfurtransferase TusA family protein [Alphaproteobacteria bacterium]MCZ6610237.1 sulfurtransferase TusA family protein [Alphaproteobacteria bacterium]MCZ6813544.1 sulfurtransferase TusA family protein [Alphaproteobacteria bacterium]MCZ6849153.1 sulfurtransferase TusA family protein [Alphaproteobacteria bacterium]
MVKHYLDITGDTCPLTFVKTKILIESMVPGELAVVRLKGAEPLGNVPRSVREHGHQVISLEPAVSSASGQDDVHILTLRKSADQSSNDTE